LDEVQSLVEGTASAIISFSVELHPIDRELPLAYYAFMESGGGHRQNDRIDLLPPILKNDWCHLPSTDMAGSFVLSDMFPAVGACGLQSAAMIGLREPLADELQPFGTPSRKKTDDSYLAVAISQLGGDQSDITYRQRIQPPVGLCLPLSHRTPSDSPLAGQRLAAGRAAATPLAAVVDRQVFRAGLAK
jgi:hypothetical protein